MSDLPSGPAIDSSYLHRQMQQAQGQGGSGSAPIFLGARLDTNVGSPFSIQQASPIGFDKMVLQPKQRPNGPIAGLLKQMGLSGGEIYAGLQKVAQAGGVQQASIADITGQSHGLGGGMQSFAARVGGDGDLGVG